MTIDHIYDEALRNMAAMLASFETRVPAVQRVRYKDGFVFRYTERTIEQAIIQKLARLVSGLYAARLLYHHGFFQEQAALQRMLDEFREDAMFLAYGAVTNDITDLHREYLTAFYEEEFDHDDPLRATQRRPTVPRRKIHAYISRIEGTDVDASTGVAISRTLRKAYSGFVHGASPQIMDMYGGSPPRFHVAGMLGTPHQEDYRQDFWNYMYRAICTFGLAAAVFGDAALLDTVQRYRDEFEHRSRDYGIGMPGS